MSRLYLCFRWFARRWLWLMFVLVVGTVSLGMLGFAREKPSHSLATDLYQTIQLFTRDNGYVAENVGWELESARWLGVAVWAFTIATVLVKLFSRPLLIAYIAIMARLRRGHIILAGLGQDVRETNCERLIEKLRHDGRDVIVIEPNEQHHGLAACRSAGALCLIGNPSDPSMLARAQLTRASTLLALDDDDRINMTILTAVASPLATPAEAQVNEDPFAVLPGRVNCIMQVSEPRLLEVLRRHQLHQNPTDQLQLRPYNIHEMVARAMLRETIGPNVKPLRNILLVGTGMEGRLGEALVNRLVKDRWIDTPPENRAGLTTLNVHIIDEHAETWARCMRGAFEDHLLPACHLKTYDLPAHRCGFRGAGLRKVLDETQFDAIFICITQESQAVIQAAHLAELLPNVPIVVRVREQSTGFGGLIADSKSSGLGANIRAVGTHDRVFDVVASMNPMVEILAQVLHQDYLHLTQLKLDAALAAGDIATADKIAKKAAFKPWSDLATEYLESNRALAQRLREHLAVPATRDAKAKQYRPQFTTKELIAPEASYQISAEQLELLARREHDLWMRDMLALGWRKGHGSDPHSSDPIRKLNPNLVPWEELEPGMHDYDRNIVRRLAAVFAKADYKVVVGQFLS